MSDASLTAADMALLVAALSVRLGANVTALAQAAIDRPRCEVTQPLLAPVGGAFNGAMAARLTVWKQA